MFDVLLKYSFLVIFVCTAILGICSLPRWIKIPEYYRKKIFLALILEVVGAIVLVFKDIQSTNGLERISRKDITVNNHWMALDDNAKYVAPEIKIRDSIYPLQWDSIHFIIKNLSAELGDNSLKLFNTDKHEISRIAKQELEKLGLFNTIETAKNEISSSENYAYIKWNKGANDTKWSEEGQTESPFHLEVYDDNNKTKYKIENRLTGTPEFYSDSKSAQLFNEDNRINHFFSYNKSYYLVRIAFADLRKNTDNYVSVIYIKLRPSFNIE